jgi:hypothetical protein
MKLNVEKKERGAQKKKKKKRRKGAKRRMVYQNERNPPTCKRAHRYIILLHNCKQGVGHMMALPIYINKYLKAKVEEL